LMYAIGFGLIATSIIISGRFSPKPGDNEYSPDPIAPLTQPGESEG